MSNNAVKDTVLAQLKAAWKVEVIKQYQKEPDKVKNSNIEKNANDIMSNTAVRINAKMVGFKKEDIVRILTEIKDEVIKEN